MDFIDKIANLSAKIQRERGQILTEEAAKTAWVLPFIDALGYCIFDPNEIIPEFTADVGVKKGEKVDYCVQKDGVPIILIECKGPNTDLDIKHASQLYRYFSVTKVRFAILTDGVLYRFYADLDEMNVMDSKPFFEFNMSEIKESSVEELKKFGKSSFDLDQILATASELKYTREVKRILAEQMVSPSDDFVRLLATDVYPGPKTQTVVKQFADVVRRAFQQLLSDRVSDRLKSALAEEAGEAPESRSDAQPLGNIPNTSGIVTTEDEIQGFYIIKAILREVTDVSRITLRDAASYCAILLDNNNRKPICRLHFGATRKQISLFDGSKQETKREIASLDAIYDYSAELRAVVAAHDETLRP